MKVGIYVDVLNNRLRGIGYHVYQLLYNLSLIDKKNEYFLYSRRNFFHNSVAQQYCPKEANFHLRTIRFPKKWLDNHPTLWWDYYLPFLIKNDQLDIFHSPNYFLPASSQVKSIVTIHDLAFFKMELYTADFTKALILWTEKALKSANRIIAISENSRKDIEDLGVKPKRIRLIYGGGNVVDEEKIRYEHMNEVRKIFNLPEKYILFVGVLHPRKNIPFLIRSYAKLKQSTALSHGLVIAGLRDAAGEEIDQLIQELHLSADVTITGYVDDWQLPLLYKHADLFVLPTLYEGFTLVTLEAMSYGIPVVATDCSSIREGVGDAATLVPCNDIDAMIKAMHELLTDNGLRQQRIAMGREQAKKFTWHHCASETLALYEEVYENKCL